MRSWVLINSQNQLLIEQVLYTHKHKIFFALIQPSKNVPRACNTRFNSHNHWLWPGFSPVHIHGRLLEQFSGSKAAFGTTFKVTSGYRNARTGFLNRFTRRILIISKWFYISKQKPFLNFLHKKTAKTAIVKTISILRKSTFLFLRQTKQNSSHDTVPLL